MTKYTSADVEHAAASHDARAWMATENSARHRRDALRFPEWAARSEAHAVRCDALAALHREIAVLIRSLNPSAGGEA